jgi:hypothetical protein
VSPRPARARLCPEPDLLVLAADAAAILEPLGVVAYGKRVDGRVTLDGWASSGGKRIAFSYELDDDDARCTAEELAFRCAAKVQEAIADQ